MEIPAETSHFSTHRVFLNLLQKSILSDNFIMRGPFSMERHIVSPLSVRPSQPSVPYITQMVSVRYLLKRLVYWIEILYTQVYNHKM